jgi:hypothetical protein
LADPVTLGFNIVELLIVVVGKAKATELPLALKLWTLAWELREVDPWVRSLQALLDEVDNPLL